eukprot:3255201-Rhodomonas_salina.1
MKQDAIAGTAAALKQRTSAALSELDGRLQCLIMGNRGELQPPFYVGASTLFLSAVTGPLQLQKQESYRHKRSGTNLSLVQ